MQAWQTKNSGCDEITMDDETERVARGHEAVKEIMKVSLTANSQSGTRKK